MEAIIQVLEFGWSQVPLILYIVCVLYAYREAQKHPIAGVVYWLFLAFVLYSAIQKPPTFKPSVKSERLHQI